MKIVIGTKNPVKIKATIEAFQYFYDDLEYETFDLSKYSSVLKQPMSINETLDSALKRIEIIEKKSEKVDYYVALEGGVGIDSLGFFLTGYVAIKSISGKISISGGYRMPLPKKLFDELQKNKEIELGDIIDKYSGTKNSKQKDGAIGLFTSGKLTRKETFKQMIILALVPFTSSVYSKIEDEEKN